MKFPEVGRKAVKFIDTRADKSKYKYNEESGV
jgi:hypothetical protein